MIFSDRLRNHKNKKITQKNRKKEKILILFIYREKLIEPRRMIDYIRFNVNVFKNRNRKPKKKIEMLSFFKNAFF